MTNKQNNEENSEENSIQLHDGTSLLSTINELESEERQELIKAFAQGQLDVHKKAAELAIDAQALQRQLEILNNAASDASRNDSSITIKHEAESELGNTNIVMGNTEEAAKGGKKNLTPIIIIIGIIVVGLVGISLANSL